MSMARRIEAMWWCKDTPPLLLRWASSIYDLINRRNLASRVANAMNPPLPMISVGNITVGGSGKTPFVIWLCGELLQRDYKPVVLCRGDGGKLKHPKHVLPDDDASEVGDEALLLALRCNAPVIAGRDRVAGAQLAATLGNVIVLDDGFQYLQLSRSCNIVLIPTEGIGNGHLLPAGPLRETLDALTRADLVVRTGNDHGLPLSTQREWGWRAEVQAIRPLCGGEIPAASPCLALAGIARAERFFSTASKAANIKETMRFADHHRYNTADIAHILKTGLPVLTTEKDAVKLLPLWPKDRPLSALPISGKGQEGLPEAIIRTMLSHRENNG